MYRCLAEVISGVAVTTGYQALGCDRSPVAQLIKDQIKCGRIVEQSERIR